jgi:hypothetical protein
VRSAPKNNIKRIKPYPFEAQIKDDRSSRAGQIILLTETSALIDSAAAAVLPGDKLEVSFLLPVLAESVQFSAVVVKVYNHLSGLSAPQGSLKGAPQINLQRLEVHFRSIDSLSRNHIERFLDQIGQRRRS